MKNSSSKTLKQNIWLGALLVLTIVLLLPGTAIAQSDSRNTDLSNGTSDAVIVVNVWAPSTPDGAGLVKLPVLLCLETLC